MLTKTQLKIVAYLLDNQSQPFGIRELARGISTVYYLVQKNVHQLKKMGVITLQEAGKTSLVNFHHQVNPLPLIAAEEFKRELFYQKYPSIKVTLRKITEQAETCFFVLLVFGSYAKQPRTDSDLDLLLIVPDQKQVKIMERIIFSTARLSTVKIHDVIITENSFRTMFNRKELNVVQEAKEKHILIYGDDLYYKLLQ
ncbi:hypothetical protein HYX14_01390 [Candidatus Woesearchaeota archaeon]|nr:hypothetical protein [Candidatus Woesearchaeota archaeon]